MTPSPDIPEREIRERCATILSASAEEARREGHNHLGTEHLFIAATRNENGPTCRLLRRAGLVPRDVRNAIRREVGKGEGVDDQVLPLTPRTEMVLSLAIFLAEQDDMREITEHHLLMALLQEGEGVPVRKLIDLGFDINLWLQRLIAEEHEDNGSPAPADSELFSFLDSDSDFDPDSNAMTRRQRDGDMRVPTPLLDKYGRDLTAQAAGGKIGPAIARETEIRAISRTLSRSKKNNPLLLGDAGVGKTAVVEGLAYAIQTGSAPPSLLNKRIVQIEIGTLVAGTSLRGQFEERLIGIVDEAKNSGNTILFIDEIHTIVGAGDTIDSNLDAANILKPALARGEIMCIGATTHEEYRRAIAQDPALDRRFRTIDIEEPSEDDTLEILKGQQQRLENHHGVVILPETLHSAVKLSVRYMPDRRLPDKALDLLDEACTRVIIRTRHPDEVEDKTANDVRPEDVAVVLSEWTGIPAAELTQDEKRRIASIEKVLFQRVVGQDQAIHTVAESIKTARAGLGDPNRPIGVFLFLGPSGVGKTELARALAEFLFGSGDAMMRLDMSEFHDSHTVARLIGSPPGYKDTSRGGQLTDGLRRRPYCVVLLDEVEKAAPEVFDIFLQVFDEGRISDAHGRKVDARHAVFIMTSNIGTQEGKRSPLGFFSSGDALPDYTGHLDRFFRPEFLNRIEEIITFKPLTKEVVSRIMDLQLKELHQRLEQQKLTLEISEEARELVLVKGYDAANGARPMRRAIERFVTRPLSARILDDEFNPGDTIRAVLAEDKDRLSFEAVVHI
ncbi:MAG: ATP-dependent Clp protease ATP-binding subunit [Anaerolineae bacterium]|nr:ATP-dependent Clp protease ATP-binding subunit [Anaerolineae bacterium]